MKMKKLFIIILSVFFPLLLAGKDPKRMKINIPDFNSLDEESLGKLIDDFVEQGLIGAKEGKRVKKEMDSLTADQWNQIRKIRRKSDRAPAAIEGALDGVEDEGSLMDKENFDMESYRKMSAEVESVLNSD